MPYTYAYPHPAVATDVAIFTLRSGVLQVLLIQRGLDPFLGGWALPGGFVRPDEDLKACARRELREETGVDANVLLHFANYSAPDRDPRERVISVAYLALLPAGSLEVAAQSDADDARWFAVDGIPKLAFDHDLILQDALEALRDRVRDLDLLFALLPPRFTLSALQAAFEAVVGAPAEKRNFRKMAAGTGRLVETDEYAQGSHRPARLWESRR